MPAREVFGWMTYARIEPIGAERDDLRAGYAAAVKYNLTRHPRAAARKPSDFMPEFKRARVQTGEQIWSVLSTFAAVQNAKVQ